MNIDDVIEAGLAAAAEDYDVPAGAIDALREQLRPAGHEADKAVNGLSRLRRLRPHVPQTPKGRVGLAAAAAVLVIAVPLTIGGALGDHHSNGLGPAQAGPAVLGSGQLLAQGSRVEGTGQASTSSNFGTTAKAPGVPNAGTQSGASGSVVAGTAPQPARRVHAAEGLAAGNQQAKTSAGSGMGGPDSTALTKTLQLQPFVVHNGNLSLQVQKGQVATTLQKLTALANQDGGYVQSSQSQTAGNSPYGSVTLRIPAGNFQRAVNQASHLKGSKVQSLQTSGQDVTGKVVDLSARIDALQRTRSTYLTILSHATTIGATLEVQDRISGVQSQIEQLQGQRKLLTNEASESTLRVNVDQPQAKPNFISKKPSKPSGLSKAFHTSVHRFTSGVDGIVAIIGPILLILLLAGLVVLVGWFGTRRLRRSLV